MELVILRIEDLILVSQSPGVILFSLEMDPMLKWLLELKDDGMMEGDCSIEGLGKLFVDQL